MNATLRQIRSFVVLAERASFTQAAALLHISQPALTAEDRMHVIFPAGHPVDKMRSVTLRKLADYPMVMMDPQTSTRGVIDAAFEAADCMPQRACEVTFLSTAVAMVRAGLGITILPSTAIEWRAHKGLKSRAIAEPSLRRQVGVFRKAGRSLPPASEAFVASLTRSWSARPTGAR